MKYQVFGILWTVFNLALMLVMGIVGIYPVSYTHLTLPTN